MNQINQSEDDLIQPLLQGQGVAIEIKENQAATT